MALDLFTEQTSNHADNMNPIINQVNENTSAIGQLQNNKQDNIGYEQGVFTPTLDGNCTYNTQGGAYTRIGNIVYVDIKLQLASLDSSLSATDISIRGLPFNAVASSSLVVGYVQGMVLPAGSIGVEALTSGTSIPLYAPTTSGPTRLKGSALSNTSDIRLSGVYRI